VTDVGAPCNDNDPCTKNDRCTPTGCEGLKKDCSDGDRCTDDKCNRANGECYWPLNTGATCDEDGDPCTDDVCDHGECTHPLKDCTQEFTVDPCTTAVYCDPEKGCMRDWPCNDGDPCTSDWCMGTEEEHWCQNNPYWPYWPEGSRCSTYGCSGNISIGNTILPLNNDDGNGTPDLVDTGTVAGENDLRPVELSLQSCADTTCDAIVDSWIVHPSFTPIELFRGADKTERIVPHVLHPFPAPDEIFAEGTATTDDCGEPIRGATGSTYEIEYHTCCGVETAPRRVVAVERLYWERHISSEGVENPELTPCPINGGVRIFPGLVDPNDIRASTRRKVNLVAEVSPPIAGVWVNFRIWDVDDPFDQLYGPLHRDGVEEIANVSVIDSNTLGNDNRGVAPCISNPCLRTASTDEDGKATVTISMSLKPGDNYRAAATCLPYVLSETTTGTPPQVRQNDADRLGVLYQPDGKYYPNGDDEGYKVPVVWSKMLTVWRKLHVETDTMVRPTFAQNTFTMNWGEPVTGNPSSVVLFEVADPPEAVLKTVDDQFNGGYVELQDPAGNTILTSKIQQYWTDEDDGDEDGNELDQVRINLPDCGNGQSGLACLGGVTSGTAILSDDDLSVQATFNAKTWGCNDSFSGPIASLAPPDLTMMANRYNLAYIEPVHDLQTSAVQGLVTLIRNWDEGQDQGKALWDQVLPARNLPVSTADFWTVMVVSAWQAEEPEDGDPDAEDQVGIGITKGVDTHPTNWLGYTSTTSDIEGAPGADYTGMCAVFKAVFGESYYLDFERFTVVHEVGHTFGLDHRAGGAMCERGDCQREPFQAVELKELRDYVQP